MRHTLDEVKRRLELMHNDDGDPGEWDVHHWQDINPVITETLMQLTMGNPGVIYHGGLCHARLRYFDLERKRAGLPEGVSARVGNVTQHGLDLELVSLEHSESREIVVQAGAFAEHLFTRCELMGETTDVQFDENAGSLRIVLKPSASLNVHLSMKLYARTASYALPF
jgi:hypothetical protein